MTDELKHCETCDTPMLGRCEFCALKAENLSLRTHHTALRASADAVVLRFNEWVGGNCGPVEAVRMGWAIEKMEATLKPLSSDADTPNPPHPAEKGKP